MAWLIVMDTPVTLANSYCVTLKVQLLFLFFFHWNVWGGKTALKLTIVFWEAAFKKEKKRKIYLEVPSYNIFDFSPEHNDQNHFNIFVLHMKALLLFLKNLICPEVIILYNYN